METELFGICLRRAREARRLSLADVAMSTKISRSTLEQLEASNLDDLPADVFVRGFIRSYSRSIGTDEREPLHAFERALSDRRAAEQARSIIPVVDPQIAAAAAEDEASPRRGLGLAVFVIILLLIATITLSLLLRHPPPSGEGLSQGPRPAPAAASAGEDRA